MESKPTSVFAQLEGAGAATGASATAAPPGPGPQRSRRSRVPHGPAGEEGNRVLGVGRRCPSRDFFVFRRSGGGPRAGFQAYPTRRPRPTQPRPAPGAERNTPRPRLRGKKKGVARGSSRELDSGRELVCIPEPFTSPPAVHPKWKLEKQALPRRPPGRPGPALGPAPGPASGSAPGAERNPRSGPEEEGKGTAPLGTRNAPDTVRRLRPRPAMSSQSGPWPRPQIRPRSGSEPSEQGMRLPHPAARRRPRGRVAKLTRGGRNRASHCSRLGAPPRAASPLPSGSRVAGHSREGKGGDRGRVPQLPPAPAASPLITWAPLTRPAVHLLQAYNLQVGITVAHGRKLPTVHNLRPSIHFPPKSGPI